MSRYPGKTNAPEFPPDLDWINTPAALRLKELRGKIVLLDFWTYCCINCMHILPDLKRLEQKYAAVLVVIGVHSAKFDAERATSNILQAVMRYEIEHPVVNDNQMILWREYGVRAWPSVVVIDPLGKVVGLASGEGVFDALDPLIADMVREFDLTGQLDHREFERTPTAQRMPRTVLSFPGKVLADAQSGRLFIADSNHNRIVVCGFDGVIQEVAGSGTAGIEDGPFENAMFNHPQGMCLIDGSLFVADTENHAIRRLDLTSRHVHTVSGDGTQSRRVNPPEGTARTFRLNSPWDLIALDDVLYIAMAGPHQIWKLDLKTGIIGPFAGSGREALVDGTLRDAALAQPSGITSDGQTLYFADSETSSIRSASIGKDGEVGTLVGRGLFEFGDVDGAGETARLQHPLGLVFHRGMLYVADTYNNKVRKIDPATREVTSVAAGFDEPAGLSAAGNRLYVADTNNHVIKVVDLDARNVTSIELHGLEKLRRRGPWSGDTLVVRNPVVVERGFVSVNLEIDLAEDYQLTADAPQRILFSLDDGEQMYLAQPPLAFPVVWTANVNSDSTLNIMVELYYCHTGDVALCFYKESLFTVPIQTAETSANHDIRVVCRVTD